MWWEYPVPAGSGRDPIIVMAPKEALPRHLRVHLRGNRFTPGQLVRRGPVQVVDEAAFPAGDRADRPDFSVNDSGRLALARWIASPRNPLTARVMVNRIWQHHFGRGLVGTSDNFGARGDRPTHPELLDWLAARFIESGWSIRAVHRLVLSSATWQQQSQQHPAARQGDPDGRWLSFVPRRRLSAEELRDAVLAVSGRLDDSVGGNASGEFLWGEAEDIRAMIRPNRVPADHPWYTSFTGRSIYLPIVRNILPDVLNLFDAADPNGVTAVRNDTTVPGQSLFLLNSEFLREQARNFAARLQATGDTAVPDVFTAKVDRALRLVTGRGASADDVSEARRFISDYQSHSVLAGRAEAERVALAWQSYCQALLCSNDFIYVE